MAVDGCLMALYGSTVSKFIQEVIYVGIPSKTCIDLHFWGEPAKMDD
jgi:hypothetical protein